MRNDTTVEDFKKIVVWHTIKKVKRFFKDVDGYLEAPLASKAEHLTFPRGYLKRLCRQDSTTHTKDFCKQAGFIYHGKTRSGLPPWIEVPEKVLDAIWLKRKTWSAKSNYYTKRQQKWIAKYYDAVSAMKTCNGMKRDRINDNFDKNATSKEEDKTMTKAREEQIRQECAEGKHGVDADYLIKQEKKQERAAMKQKLSVAKRAAKETLSDYTKLQLEVEKLRAENKKLKELVNGLANENADNQDEADLKEKLRAELREELMQELTREHDEEMRLFEASEYASDSSLGKVSKIVETISSEESKKVDHPEDDMPLVEEVEQQLVEVPKDDIPSEEIEPKVYQHFSSERLQHFVDKLYISHSEAGKIAEALKIKFSIRPNRQGFSSKDAWNHKKERKTIFTTLQREAGPVLDDTTSKWLRAKLM